MSSLNKQVQFNDSFTTWFNSEVKPTLESSRRRYRMEHEDAKKREELGLSAVPSTKSAATVDRSVERAIMEYHGEQDAISFTAKNAGDKNLDFLAAIHTENFHIRSQTSFPFAVWNSTSLTAGFVDGLEAAIVSWRKEAYTEKRQEYFAINETGMPAPVDEEMYNEYSKIAPEMFFAEDVEEEIKVIDTWWVDQLIPGENVLWDVKAPLLDINMGQACLVKMERSVDAILEMSEAGIIDKITKEELRQFQDTSTTDEQASTFTDPDMDDYNRVELWIWFTKDKSQWWVEFSLEGKKKLSEKQNINDAWYNGRRVNRLPVVVGTTKLKPFVAMGRGIPETIKPIEDEYEKTRNLLLDAARQDVEGRWRVNPGSDIDLNELINSPIVRANVGDVEKFDNRANSMTALQQSGALTGDINELAPVGMESSQVVPSGTDKTLGAIQMAMGSSNEKLSVALLVRNFTFFKPLLYLISELTIAFETDENILRIAESRVAKGRDHKGMKLPQQGSQIDLKSLDIPLDIQINAGLGSVPRQQKLQYMQYLGEAWGRLGIPLDGLEMFRQGSVLLGFGEDQFISTEPPQSKGPELKADIKIDFDRLPPAMQMKVLEMFANSSSELDFKFNSDGKFPQPRDLPPVGSQQQPVEMRDMTGGQGGY
jgi:hypothetical protein